MWLLHFLPDSFILWVTNIILLAGLGLTIAAFFLKSIPLLNQYRLPAQILGIVFLVLGVYFRGGYSVEMQWRERVAELEGKVAESEQHSKEANVVIKKVYVDRVKLVTEQRVVVQEKIKEVAKAIDAECKITPEAIDVLNTAARTKQGTVTVGPMQPEGKQ